MDDTEKSGPPIRVLARGVDALTSVEVSELSGAALPGFVLALRREMDRIDAVFAEAVTAAHRRGAGTGDGYESTAAWLRWQAGMRTNEVRSAIAAGEVGELLPETRSAWRAGRITSGAMRAISAARVEGSDPQLQASEPEFLAAATRKDMWSLQRLTAHFRACAKRDGTLPPERSGLRSAIVGDRLVLDGEIHGLPGETIARVLESSPTGPHPTTTAAARNGAPTRCTGSVASRSTPGSTPPWRRSAPRWSSTGPRSSDT